MSSGLILSATGEPANAPVELNEEELEIVLRCFGMTKRNGKPVRNRFSLGTAGRLAPKKLTSHDVSELPEVVDPRVALVNSMAQKGLVRMFLDSTRLVKRKQWRGDMAKADLTVHVTPYGAACFAMTIKTSLEARALAMKAGKA